MDGNVKYTVQSETRKLSPGNIILIQPGKVHFCDIKDNQNYERYVLKFQSSLLPDYLKNALLKIPSFFNKTKKFSFIFEKIDDYLLNYQGEELYTLLVCELLRLCIFLKNEKTDVLNQKNEFLDQVIEYIDEHIYEDINTKKLSEVFYYSPSYIDYEFKNEMKMSVTKYVKKKKIYLANQLVIDGMKVNEAAEKVGFKDYSTFYRSYIKVMGNKPSESKNKF